MRLIYLLIIFISCNSPEQDILSDPNIIFTITENHIIYYNEEIIDIDSLISIIAKEKRQYSKDEQEKFHVILKPDDNTKVSFIEDIKEKIKDADTYNLTYCNQDGRSISTVMAKDKVLATILILPSDKIIINNTSIDKENLNSEIIRSVKKYLSDSKDDSKQNSDKNLFNYKVVYAGSRGAAYEFYVETYHIVNETIKELNEELNLSIKINEVEPK